VEVICIQYYAGLDIHKKTCQAIICTEKGDVVKQGRIPTEKDKIQEFFSEYGKIEITPQAIRNAISQIRRDNPGLTLNAAAKVFADKKGISVMRYLSDDDRKSLRYLKKFDKADEIKIIPKKVQVKVAKTSYGKKILKEANQNASIYPYVFILENSIRELILDIFSGENDLWSTKVSRDVQDYADRIQQAEKKHDWLTKRGNHPIYYIGLNELFKIISKNYSAHFKHIFSDQGNLRTWINECVPIRNLLAHNVKVNPEERQNLIIRTKYICTMIERNHKKSRF